MKKNSLGSILVLLVFAVFMVSVLTVLLTGADAVQKTTQRGQESYNRRTTAQYLTTRIRQAEQAGNISLGRIGGEDALILSEEIEGETYETLVYCHDGYLREMFCLQGTAPGPEFGELILPVRSLALADHGSFLLAEITYPDGEKDTLTFALRCERGTAS